MGNVSKIEWTDATWNPFYGCHKVSPGCAYCYMDRWAKRTGRDPERVTRAKDATFYAPLHWKKPRRIFTCSLSDFFIDEADEWREEAWEIMRQTQHTYLVLTKRIDRVLKKDLLDGYNLLPLGGQDESWPWPNVWLGVSVENQIQADERIPKLLQIPAAKRFVSIEPLLRNIGISQYLYSRIDTGDGRYRLKKLDWVIVGGESGGPEHRMLVYKCYIDAYGNFTQKPHFYPRTDIPALDWVRSLRDQCQAAGVPLFFKQWGGSNPTSGGRLLDGQEWNEIPK